MSPKPLPADLEVFITADGSPTLALKREDGYIEKMHHSGGALSESFYIYFAALTRALEAGAPASVLSLGLGCGYNELLAVGEFLKRGLSDWKVYSFEFREDLREGFRAWLARGSALAEDGARPQDSELESVFREVLTRVAGRLEVPAASLFIAAREGLSSGRLELRGAFPADVGSTAGCGCVFYDAFSKKMDPQLWTEYEMESELKKITSQKCVISTYAATGALNRALKKLGFELMKRPGFEGKRESTFAERGI